MDVNKFNNMCYDVVTVCAVSQQIRVARNELKNLRTKLEQLRRYNDTQVNRMTALFQGAVHRESDRASLKESNRTELLKEQPRWQMQPIGTIQTIFREKNGTPRQPSICTRSTTAKLILNTDTYTNPCHAIEGLKEFSHIWLIFVFHKSNTEKFTHAKVAPPRLNGQKSGVFGTRSPHRPNPIGLSLAKLNRIEGACLHLSCVDLLDGTPILDIKPYIPQYDNPLLSTSSQEPESRVETGVTNCEACASDDPHAGRISTTVTVPDWILRPPVKQFQVVLTDRAKEQFACCCCEMRLSPHTPDAILQAVQDILKEDPRSVYRRNRCSDRLYYFSYHFLHLTCWFDDDAGIVDILKVQLKKDSKLT